MNLNFPMSKSRVAFLWSVERLEEISTVLYFWTFTWRERNLPTLVYRRSWNRFTVALRRRLPASFAALRVWEHHPGGHGLHVHMLTNTRIDVKMARVLLSRAGMGFVCHVRKAKKRDAEYISKYMTKAGRIRGVKQWSKLGKWWHMKVKNLIDMSSGAVLLRNIYHSPEVQGLPPRQRWARTQVIHQLAQDKLEAAKERE